jgi:NADH-quinone oxidoreductase subunit J
MNFLAASTDVAWTAGVPFQPLIVLILCVLAGVGTIWLLPGRRDANWRSLGGTLIFIAVAVFAAFLIRWALGSSTKPGVSYIYFWLFSLIALGASLRVITHPKPVYSALYFVLTVFASAGLFVLMWAEFMAVALVLIYAGAILVTYVFVIMLAAEAGGGGSGALSNIPEHDAIARSPRMACLIGFALMGVMMFVIFDRAPTSLPKDNLGGAGDAVAVGHTQQLGRFLFDYHFVNIQLAGLLLTIAMIGAIMIARKRIVTQGGGADEIAIAESPIEIKTEVVLGRPTPVDDNPHAIPVIGTMNPRQKEYPEN